MFYNIFSSLFDFYLSAIRILSNQFLQINFLIEFMFSLFCVDNLFFFSIFVFKKRVKFTDEFSCFMKLELAQDILYLCISKTTLLKQRC